MNNESDPGNQYQKDFEDSIQYGVSFDNVNLRTVSFWIVLGIIIVAIILYGVYNMYTYNQFLSSQQAAIEAEFHELEEMRERDQERLHSVSMVDEEEGRYRIPIDSAMTLIVRQHTNDNQE
ncbi:hypothetical protein [Natronogracilivirga saccharolytica]|uniref:Uncharacterized protein n=1 Tax=Natronogracilivirga saccharolytica TaxID=2812953 RepID=A0A8J7UU34_9BACT|nr:hypothetical protein [Natronogracilivirga saccharolytica]MBP3191072.1 hypothetical protein [Natronogracilivirga saccharolytica]